MDEKRVDELLRLEARKWNTLWAIPTELSSCVEAASRSITGHYRIRAMLLAASVVVALSVGLIALSVSSHQVAGSRQRGGASSVPTSPTSLLSSQEIALATRLGQSESLSVFPSANPQDDHHQRNFPGWPGAVDRASAMVQPLVRAGEYADTSTCSASQLLLVRVQGTSDVTHGSFRIGAYRTGAIDTLLLAIDERSQSVCGSSVVSSADTAVWPPSATVIYSA